MKKIRNNYFANDKYIILKIINDNMVNIKNDFVAPLTQQDISELAHFSKVKTNNIINELIRNGFADTFNSKRGKYVVTKKGQKIIELMEDTI